MKNANNIKCIYDITKFSQLDYPEKLSCIIWFTGCNMRCVYCYNPQIILSKGKKDFKDVISFLNTRKELLDAVVFSGGECTSHLYIIEYARWIKENGFLLKIDTNGSNPHIITKLLQENLIDFISLDFKSLPEKEKIITGSKHFSDFNTCIDEIQKYQAKYEIRTTIHSDFLDTNDILKMYQHIKGRGYTGNYYLQIAKTNTPTLFNLPTNYYNLKELTSISNKIIIRN